MNSVQTGLGDQEDTRFFTIGYGGLSSVQELKEIMDRHGITRIVDVRSKTWTRRISLKELTAAFGDSYISRLDMGGLDFEVDQYQEWLDRAAAGVVMLEELGREHRVLVLCAEKSHRHCHSNFFVGRALGEDGYGVRHL